MNKFIRYANLTDDQKALILEKFYEAKRFGSDPGHAAACAGAALTTNRGWNGKIGADAFAAALAYLVISKEIEISFKDHEEWLKQEAERRAEQKRRKERRALVQQAIKNTRIYCEFCGKVASTNIHSPERLIRSVHEHAKDVVRCETHRRTSKLHPKCRTHDPFTGELKKKEGETE